MNNIHTIIGTAGHVDHGKTSLIKALTGIETDRLKEEKKRGITIELGFAYLTLPSGERAGIIDVPGHEKFIRNMLSGAGSIDLALMIIAADEGIMPQTREHLDILSLLNIQRGVVVLTKTDLVEKEWLEMVLQEIREQLAGTFLANAPIYPVSAYTGEGIPELKQCLFDLLEKTPAKSAHTPFRMPVDRVFTSDGFGTVVTGTLIEGEISAGDTVTVFPSMMTAKVRNLQTHDQKVPTLCAGQRAAVNLAGLPHTDLHKGDVLAAGGSMKNQTLLDVRLDVLKSTERKLMHGSRLHLYHGTRDLLCSLRLLDRDSVGKGERAYAQLNLYEPLAAKPGDRFVLRFYSPLETVGGGIILDPSPQKYLKRQPEVIEAFKIKETGSLSERIAQMILDRSEFFPLIDELKYTLFGNNPQFDKEVSDMIAKGELVKVGDKRIVHKQFLETTGQRCKKILSAYHSKNPLNKGMPRSELWQPLLPQAEKSIADKVIELLVQNDMVKIVEGQVANSGFNVVMSDQHRKLCDAIAKTVFESGFTVLSYDELSQSAQDKKTFKQAFDALVGEGTIVMLAPQIVVHKEHCDRAWEVFKRIASKKPIMLVDFRDALETSRKNALALLEYFDNKKLTKRTGDAREINRG